MPSTKTSGATITDGIASGLTLDATCDVTLATGAGGGPATQLDANGTTLDVDAITDGQFLKRSGTTIISAAGAGDGLGPDGDKGDITVGGTGTTLTIDNDAVTYAKMQNVSATDKVLGRSTSGAGDVEEITCTAAGRALIDDASAAAQLTTLGAEPLTCIARGTGAAIAVNSTSVVNMASATNTLAAGDTLSFYLAGYVLNNSGGTRTYTIRVTIGATTFDLAVSPTYATSASNVGWLNVVADVSIISSSLIGCTIQCRAGASAAVATVQSNVLANDRNIVRTSTNNETGSKTVAIGMLSDVNTATQTFTKTRAEIYKGGTI